MDRSSGSRITEEWSLHAELTVSHGNNSNVVNSQTCNSRMTDATNSNLKMEYSWDPGRSIWETTGTSPRPSYGFQRGNLLFTTSPPQCGINRISQMYSNKSNSHQSNTYPRYPTKSGDLPAQTDTSRTGGTYGTYTHPSRLSRSPITTSNTMPQNRRHATGPIFNPENKSEKYNSLPSRKPHQQYDRRCRSTCSITLHCDIPCEKPVLRTQSLRTPDVICSHCGKTKSRNESSHENSSCDECSRNRRASRAHTFTTHFCTHVLNDVDDKCSRDASSQTLTDDLSEETAASEKRGGKLNRNVKETQCFLKPPQLQDPGEEKEQHETSKTRRKKLSRSPARVRGKSPLLRDKDIRRKPSLQHSSDSKKAPRTVHIDVYCTGSEDADESDSLSSEEGNSKTVFESEDMRVTHRRAGKNEVPQRRKKKRSPVESYVLQKNGKSLESRSDMSSSCPSVDSSRTTLVDSSASTYTDITSNVSSSSMVNSDDSLVTSWKDTDVDTSFQSGTSLAKSSAVSLSQNDSFDYADAADRQRIKQMEEKWAGGIGESDRDNSSKSWKSPQTERKYLLQQKKFNDYVKSHVGSFPVWKGSSSKNSESCSEDSSDSEMGWTFSRIEDDKETSGDSSLKRGDTMKRATIKDKTENAPSAVDKKNSTSRLDSGSLSDSCPTTFYRYAKRKVLGPFGVKTPSPPPLKVESTITSPFTQLLERTECFTKAEKFGVIVGTLRKPGHHVGPAKNPDCSCENCRWYFVENQGRGRTRSVGDMPATKKEPSIIGAGHGVPISPKSSSVPGVMPTDDNENLDFLNDLV